MAGEPLIPPTDAALERLAGSLCTVLNERARSEPVLAGIRRGGVWVAERLKSALSLSEPLGEIDFGMFRDDLGRISPARPLSASRLPWDVEGRHVVLVDDVLATGRTVRAALEELFQFGRPASVTLAILVERAEPGLRELPIAPDAVGFRLCFGRARDAQTARPRSALLRTPRRRLAVSSIQLGSDGALRHLLTLEGLARERLTALLDTADAFRESHERGVKAMPILRGRTLVGLFFEPSTRTRVSFEIAARKLSADVVHFDIAQSSTRKGESVHDTLATLAALGCDLFVVRHQTAGTAAHLAERLPEGCALINAGDGDVRIRPRVCSML